MTDGQVDAWITAGLYDPTAGDAEAILELLRYLDERGATLDDLVEGQAAGTLAAAASDRLMAIDRTLSRDAAAQAVGLTVEQVDRAWLSVGLPAVPREGPAFSEGDLLLLGAFAAGTALLGFEAALQFSRVMGSALSRIADAATTGFITNVERPLNLDNARPVSLARASYDATTILVALPQIFEALFLHHVALASARSRATSQGASAYSEYRLSVGFLDLVDFTAWSRGLTTEHLAAAVNEFEEAANDRITERGARVVKNIGDAVMYVAPDPAIACSLALDLCQFVGEHPVLTMLRGAVASGSLLGRDGDYFGPTVNLAARAVKLRTARWGDRRSSGRGLRHRIARAVLAARDRRTG